MIDIKKINKYILEQIKSNNINEEMGIDILEALNKDPKKENDQMAIIGMACKFPGANNVEEYWENILNKDDKIGKPTFSRLKSEFDISEEAFNNIGNPGGILGYLDEIDKFDAGFFNIPPNEAVVMEPAQRLFLETAWEALEDAGYGGNKLYGSQTGVFVGSAFKQSYSKLVDDMNLLAWTGNMNGALASRISYLLNFRGPSMVIDTSCSSGLVALHQACLAIKNGDCRNAIAGGVNVFILSLDDKSGIIEVESDTGRVMAFDRNAKGTVWSEGVGVVFVKKLEDAINDNNSIYAVIKGSAINNDGASNGMTAPNPEAQTDVILKAWNEANVNAESISYIETHGTGTLLGDPIEIKGLTDAFLRHTTKKQFCGIGSIKTNIGHSVAASGIASLIKVIMALNKKVIPPMINFSEPNPYINLYDSPVYICDKASKWNKYDDPRRAGVSSFGFSGTNCHMVLEEAPVQRQVSIHNNCKYKILTISTKNYMSFLKLIKKYYEFIKDHDIKGLDDICYTANIGRGHYNYRAVVLFSNCEELENSLKRLILECENHQDVYSESADIFYGYHKVIYKNKLRSNFGDISEVEKRELSEKANNTLLEFIDSGETNRELLENILKIYIRGAEIDWDRLYQRKGRRRVKLPTYPFERSRFWINSGMPMKGSTQFLEQNIYYKTVWDRRNLENNTSLPICNDILIFKDSMGIWKKVKERLGKFCEKVIEVGIGEKFENNGCDQYIISNNVEDYYRLFSEKRLGNITKILHLPTLTQTKEVDGIADLEHKLDFGVYSLFHIVKAIKKNNFTNNIDIIVVTRNANEVTGDEELICPENATLFGLTKVIKQEVDNINCKCVDIDTHTDIEKVILDIWTSMDCFQEAYRDGLRYIQVLKHAEIDSFNIEDVKVKKDGVYIITGGRGGIGLEISRYLAAQNNINLAIINRSKFPDRIDWDQILESNKDSELCKRISKLKEIESKGTNVLIYSCDVSDIDGMQHIVNKLVQQFKKINGIIHCAGIEEFKPIISMDYDRFKSTIAPKVFGTWVLNHVTQAEEIDFFIMFSSIASVFGFPLQGSYAAANSYMDSFSSYYNKMGKKGLSINWPAWKETGMATKYGDRLDGAFNAITTKDAISAFENVLKRKIKNIIIGRINFENETIFRLESLPFELSEIITNEIIEKKKKFTLGKEEDTGSNLSYTKLKGRMGDGEYSNTEVIIGQVWGTLLGLNEIDINDTFTSLGGNSLYALKFEVEMEKRNINIKYSDIERYQTIKDLALYIDKESALTGIDNVDDHEINFSSLTEPENKEVKSSCPDKSETSKIIQPFNDFYYKNCFYNSLFPIVRYYGKSILPFLSNDIIVYNKNHDDNMISAEYISISPLEQVYKKAGLECKSKMKSTDLVKDIKGSIAAEKQVIVWVDCFYESIRKDTYNKKHWPHTLLVYGVNEALGEFNIVEQVNGESLSYKKQTIQFKELVDSYNGYLQILHHENGSGPTYFEYSLDNTVCEDDSCDTGCEIYTHEFLENISKNKEKIYNGFETLKEFMSEYKEIVSNEDSLSLKAEGLIGSINTIINLKKVEQYKIAKIFYKDIYLANLLKAIIDDWNFIRSIFVKYIYSKLYNIKFKLSLRNIEKIYTNECLYYEYLFEKYGIWYK